MAKEQLVRTSRVELSIPTVGPIKFFFFFLFNIENFLSQKAIANKKPTKKTLIIVFFFFLPERTSFQNQTVDCNLL